jgi:hypothetical protein
MPHLTWKLSKKKTEEIYFHEKKRSLLWWQISHLRQVCFTPSLIYVSDRNFFVICNSNSNERLFITKCTLSSSINSLPGSCSRILIAGLSWCCVDCCWRVSRRVRLFSLLSNSECLLLVLDIHLNYSYLFSSIFVVR